MDEEITRVQRTEEAAPPSAMLGNCRLGQPLGRGLLGVVYDGVNTVANKRCAIKVFHPQLPGGSVARGRYIHESETLARIGHANIVQTYASGLADGRLFTTMELLEGAPLSRLIREQAPLSRRAYFPLIREICTGLAAAHAFGIAHRHFHAGQVMVRWTGQGYEVRLLDFGTHHLLPPFNEQVAGWEWAPEHAICVAPEQVKAPAEVDSRADVYAVAVMLYEMVTGRVPFLADSFAATLEQLTTEQPVAPSRVLSVPAGLEETIMRGLEKDPRRRIPSVEALLAALDPTTATGQEQLVRAKLSTTGRYRALTADVSQEVMLPEAGTEALPPPIPGIPAGPTELGALPQPATPKLKVPRNRRLLFALIAVVVVAAGVAVTVLLLSEPEPTPSIVAPRARPAVRRAAPKKPAQKPAVPKKTKAKPAPAKPAPQTKTREDPPPAVQSPPAQPRAAVSPKGGPRTQHPHMLGRRNLKLIEGFGALEVATGDAKAEVYVDGHFKGRGKLVLLPRIPSGTHRIHLKIGEKKTPHRDVQLRPNQRLTIKF